MSRFLSKSSLDKSVFTLQSSPGQLQMYLFLDTLYARKRTKGRHFNQPGEAMSRVTASAMFFQGHDNFRGNRYLKVDSSVTVLGSSHMP